MLNAASKKYNSLSVIFTTVKKKLFSLCDVYKNKLNKVIHWFFVILPIYSILNQYWINICRHLKIKF